MQKLFTLIASFVMLLALVTGCTKQDNTNECNGDIYNSKFLQIIRTSTYDDVKALFGWEGDNYRVDSISGKKTLYYRWYTCSTPKFFIECQFTNGQLILVNKTINNGTCGDNITVTAYNYLRDNMATMNYNQVKTYLNNAGDNFRNSYNIYNSNEVHFYRFYKCSDPSKFIEVWFGTTGFAFDIRKNFQ